MARILVIEDHPAFLSVLEHCLRMQGHVVFMAAEGRTGLAIISAGGIDLVLSDIDMPGMNGISLCEKLKDTPRWSRIPVLLMTGRPLPAITQRAVQAGAAGVMAKPFTLGQLQATLGLYLMPRAGDKMARV